MLIAIDPGKATGVAALYQGEFRSLIVQDGISGFAKWWSQLPTQPTEVVVERFTIGAMKRHLREDYSAVYINGYLLGLAATRPWNITQQSVANVKAFATDDKLKRLGWYTPGAGHDNDAARHLLAFVAKRPEGQEILRRLQ